MIWPRVINLVPEGWLRSDWHARLINETGPCARNVCGKESAKVIFFVFLSSLFGLGNIVLPLREVQSFKS